MALDYDEVIPGQLWVGAFVRPDEVGELVNRRVTTVVSLQSDEDLAYYGMSVRKLEKAFAAAGIAFERMPVEDFSTELLARKMPECVAGLASALACEGARVYLHCTAGINRAPTVAAGYLIRERALPARIAWDYLRDRRACSPYLTVLQGFEEYLKSLEPGTGEHTDRPDLNR